jgi:hypothetical protein
MYVYFFLFFNDVPIHYNLLPVPRKSRPALSISTLRAVSDDAPNIFLLYY